MTDEYTSADAYAEHVANNLPDLSEVSAAALALIKAIRKLENNSLVSSIDPFEWFLTEVITEALNYNEDDRFPLYIRDAVDAEVAIERDKWIRAINREAADAKLTQPTIDLAGMVMGILGGKS